MCDFITKSARDNFAQCNTSPSSRFQIANFNDLDTVDIINLQNKKPKYSEFESGS